MENKYSLTFPQKNIWLVEKFFGKSPINTIVGIFNVNKEFDKDICEKAINKMVEVNDALRIKVLEENEDAVQYVDKYEYFSVDFFDMNGKGEEERKKLENRLTTIPFEVINSPLYYFAIVKTGEDKGYIFVKLHHLVSDAWTFGNVATSLAEYIDLFTSNIQEEISKPSYIDFINSEKEYMDSDKFTKDKEFWSEYLSGLEESVGLKENANETLIDAKRYTVRLEEKLNTMIKEYCKENRVSPYTVFMNALAIYLHRVTEKTDFVIGTPVLNRSNFREKKMMGMFVSTMPVRFKIDEKETFLEMCKKSASETMTLFRHQKYPYSLMLQDFREKNNINTNLYNVMISYQNARAEYSDNEKYTTDWMFSTKVQDQFAIHIMDMDETGILQVHFDYLVDLFEDIEIEYIAKRLFTIIQDGIENNKTIETIEIMPEEEKNKILYEFNDTKRDYPKDKTVIDLFEEQVEKTPNNIALVFEGKEMTYKELNDKANSLAWYLKDEYNHKNDVIAILQDRNANMIVSILGILKSGRTYLPIDVDLPKDRIEYMIMDSGAAAVLQDSITLEKYTFSNSCNVDNILKENSDRNINLSRSNDNCYILYTSGSTGNPKGVIVTNINVTNFIFAMSRKLNINELLNFLCITTNSFDIFVLETLLPLSFGHKIVLANRNQQINNLELSHLCLTNHVDLIQTTPSRYSLILEDECSKKWIEKCKYILIGGENVKDSIVDKLLSITKGNIYNVYGPTETTVWSTANKINVLSDNNIGTPIDNTQIYIFDNKKRILPFNVSGNLFIGGDSVARGYLNNKILTLEKFIKYNNSIIYDTGDIAILRYNDTLKYVGRKDFQVKVNGHRIELGEIENELSKLKNINEVAVTFEDNKLKAFLRCDNIDIKNINFELNKKLPNYMIPNEYIKVNEFIYTNSGKINKKRLNEIKNKEVISFSRQKEEASTEIEKRIENIVNSILNKNEKIDIYQSYIELGMDSIQLIRLTTALSNEFSKNITFEEIFHSSLKETADILLNKEINKIDISTVDAEEVELSDTQKNIFATYIINNDTKAYNLPCEIKLDLTTDIDKLIEAIKKTVNRYLVFKSNIVIKDAIPYIKINKQREINIETYNINENSYINEKNNFVRPFDLLNDILIRIKLYITDKNIYMLFDTHHIIIDGISINMLIKEIEERYNGIVTTEEKDNSYLNYLAISNNKKTITSILEEQEDISKIDYDYIDENNKEEAAIEKINISSNEYKTLNRFCKEYEITPNSMFLSALKVVVSKFTNDDSVLLGVTTSGRRKTLEQEIVGMFSNTQKYISTLNWEEGTYNYIKDTEKDVINLINKEDSKNNSSINIAYTYQNIDQTTININGKNRIKRLNDNISKFDISIEIMPLNGKYEIVLQYRKNLYKKAKMKSFLNSYKTCVLNLLNCINDKLNKIELLPSNKREEILQNFNNDKQTKFRRIEDEFYEFVKKNNIAVIHNDKKITYKELDEKSSNLVYTLTQNGVEAGDVVAVYMDKSIEFIISILGILKAGATYLPIDIEFPQDRIDYMLTDSDAKLIITKSNIKTINSNFKVLYIDKENLKNDFEKNTLKIKSDSAYVMYTSGTSGNPKGAINTHKGVVRLVKNTNYIKVTDKDNVLLSGTVSFDASIFEIWAALLNGATLHILDKEKLLNPIELESYLDKNNISVMLLTTSLFTKLALINPNMFKKVKYLLTGGDVFSSKAGNNLLNTCKNTILINAYGPTENAVISTVYNYKKKLDGEVPIGQPISNTSVQILDKCYNLLPSYALGQLYVGGIGVGNGYIGNDKLTNEVFVKNLYAPGIIYNTGDLVYYDDKNNIWFKGRKDNQIKIRGYRIELDEIKNKILSISNIHDACVVVVNKTIYAFVVSQDNVNILEILKEKLPEYMLPKKIYNLSSIPTTINGKVNTNELIKYIKENKNAKKLPRTGLEKSIYDVWCKVLNTDNFGINDDFFDIGGDSILATEVILECANKNIPITYSDLYNYRTIEFLSDISQKNMDEIFSVKELNIEELNKVVKEKNNLYTEEKRDIIVTGATGFLGAHIVEELIKKDTNRKIYCLVRSKNNISGDKRLLERLRFFFGHSLDKYYNNVIIPIETDITDEESLKKSLSKVDISGVGVIVNSAAYVKHFDSLDRFIKFNVNTTKNVANFALQNNIKMYHISTLSVSGNMLEAGQVNQDIKEKLYYTEEKFFVNQKLYNGYVYSKFLAEAEVLRLSKLGLNITILRMGNLTGRQSDGKFQPNVEENAFANRIKAFMHIKNIPDSLENMYLEFTPIDCASEAIVNIIESKSQDRVLHLFNHNHIYMNKLLSVLKGLNIDLNLIDDKKFTKKLEKSLANKEKEIEGIIIDINDKKELKYLSNIVVNSDKTIKYLEKIGFKWPIIEDEYIIKYFNYLKSIGFLKF